MEGSINVRDPRKPKRTVRIVEAGGKRPWKLAEALPWLSEHLPEPWEIEVRPQAGLPESAIELRDPARPGRRIRVASEAGDGAEPPGLMRAVDWLSEHLPEPWEMEVHLPPLAAEPAAAEATAPEVTTTVLPADVVIAPEAATPPA